MNPRYALHPDQALSVLLVEDDPGDVLIAREALAAGRLSIMALKSARDDS